MALTLSLSAATLRGVAPVTPPPGGDLLPGARCLEAASVGAELEWTVTPGTLAATDWISADLLAVGDDIPVYVLQLFESQEAKPFGVVFALLPQAQARMRVPLTLCDQHQWLVGREGAWLKAICWGAAVDPARVTRVVLRLERTNGAPVRWWLTDLAASPTEPPRLATPRLPRGPLLDALGQSALRDWPGKTRNETELIDHLRTQRSELSRAAWPSGFSRWGGWRDEQAGEGTGWFRTAQRDGRWWLVDPDGHPFWSAGIDCVRGQIDATFDGLEAAMAWCPDDASGLVAGGHGGRSANFLGANLRRAFGDGWKAVWDEVVLGLLRAIGANTVGNWSDEGTAARGAFPYVRPLPAPHGHRTPAIFRDFPDVFDPRFDADARAYAEPLRATAADPALIGYFLMNEPTWGFASQTPAEGMLTLTEACHSRDALAGWLAQRHAGDAALAAAWQMPEASFARIRRGRWGLAFSDAARRDLEAFSTVLVQRLFDTLSAACKAVDPHHMNLGARYYTTPPEWALRGMSAFDVFSINGYSKQAPAGGERIAAVAQRPVLVGEWHFGALDAGLPASGIGHVRDQAARGAAYRYYVEQSAAKPWCVGVHWFTLYDQSALGRFDGECYNIGFHDVCNRPYAPLRDAARTTHERLYDVAAGRTPPFAAAPEYLPLLFC